MALAIIFPMLQYQAFIDTTACTQVELYKLKTIIRVHETVAFFSKLEHHAGCSLFPHVLLLVLPAWQNRSPTSQIPFGYQIPFGIDNEYKQI